MRHPPVRTKANNQGFSLVEVMVGMVIGMLGIIVIMQMGTLFEGQKRTTTGGDDAQVAGALSLFGLQQVVQQAGYCFSPTAPTLGGANLSPVKINAAGIPLDANTNSITIAYGNNACQPENASGVASAATLVVESYAVIGGNLMRCDQLALDCTQAANWTQIASDVVIMKAECAGANAVRIALITRNPQLEKIDVTSGVYASTLAASAVNLTGTAVDNGFSWKNYRYKTFEALIPIRNAIWTGAAGCA